MYLVSPDYLNKNERSATLQQESPPLQNTEHSNKQNKTRARVKKKKKGTKHPYYKWVAMRGEIAEAAVGRKALIKAIADFIKVILPGTTLARKITTPKSGSVDVGTQTVRNLSTPPRFEALPWTSSAGDVYEAETSPVSTRFAGATALAYDDDGGDADTGAVSKDVETGVVSKDGDTGAVSEEEVRKFARKSFAVIASLYLSPYSHKSGVLDAEFGLSKVVDKFFIGNSDVKVDTNSDFYVRNKHFKGTRGLWELLTRKKVNKDIVSADDLKQYKSILNLTCAHLEGYEPGAPIHISRGIKFRTVIAKLFPQTKQRGTEASLRQQWERY
jgi:hypothetical protein